ncbi:MAG: type II toxin-antitoxin system PemK/MazF family toxin [Abditibacteriales bacterium]|nr:type II toxin-antitoxin system PemK/MazF family toxin [Abditibacteriales bacterium]
MAFERGDVVLVPFPFADLTTTKARPAVIVSSDTFTAAEGRLLIVGHHQQRCRSPQRYEL